jgi:glucosamine--fructose-6-phosphate aminotransferase (isomerizing)
MTSAAFDRHVASQPIEVARLLDLAVPELDRSRPLVFTGIGTSLHACRVAAAWIRILSRGAVRAVAIDAHDLALYEGVTKADQVVVVSHRGTKRYPQAVIQAALNAGATVVAISGKGAPLHEGAMTVETCEQEAASTHTISYTSSLSVLARIVCAVLGDDARRFADALSAVPDAMAATLELPLQTAAVDALAERSPAPILVAGAGLDAITGEEAALKIKEGTYRWSEGLHTEFALHGTPAVYDDRLSAILIQSDDDGGRGADLAGVLAAVGAPAFECSDRTGCEFPFVAVPALARPFAAIIPLQRLVSELASRNGASPDQTHLEAEPWHSAILGVKL